MRFHTRLALLLAVAAAGTGAAAAQPISSMGGPVGSPDVYVCTADATVLRLTAAGKAETIASGSGSFDDCVLGPDGLLYISNGTQIVRTDPGATSKKPPVPSVVASGLPSPARGLAFNGNTLYISTATSGIYTLAGSVLQPAFPARPGEGRGLAFEINGTLAAAYSTAAGGTIERAPYNYDPPAGYQAQQAFGLGAASPRGIAVNTCGDVVFADASGGTVSRLLKSSDQLGLVVPSYSGLIPLNLEIDSSNRHYILFADDDSGRTPRIVRADPKVTTTDGQAWITTCDSFTLTELIRLNGKQAVGLAIGPSAHRLTWNRDSLEHLFNFGYHQASYRFDTAASRLISATAYRTPPSYVRFSNAFPAGSFALPYSPLGGQAVQIVLEKESSPFPLGLVEGRYSYYSQSGTGRGIGRAADDYVGPPSGNQGVFDEQVQHDLWDLGAFDAITRETGDQFSKRVIFEAPAGCRVESFLEPFASQNPLFNGPQTIPVTIQLAGTDCANRQVRLSIVRLTPTNGQAFELQTVRSAVQFDNYFASQGDFRYKYVIDVTSLNTSGATQLTPVEFKLTVWGDVVPASRTFAVAK